MRFARLAVIGAVFALAAIASWPVSTAPAPAATYQQFLSPASPLDLAAAKMADRIAWIAFEEGKRNAYAAAAPAFAPVRLTRFLKDDGIDMSDVQISDDGSVVTFIRGSVPNRAGWVANPGADPRGAERAVWAARTAGGAAFRVAELPGAAALAPDGSAVVFAREGQIYRAKVSQTRPASEIDRGEKPFIREWGTQSAPAWSPDGRKIAFVSTRMDHSFVAVYDVGRRTVKYMSPSVDFDATPLWSGDSRSLVFIRRPGLPFALAGAAGRRGHRRAERARVSTERGRRPRTRRRPGRRG